MHDLPVFYWFELNKTGDLKNLLIDRSQDLDGSVVAAYYQLKNEYFEAFGVPADYEKHIASMKYYALLMAKYLESGGQRSMLTHISISKSKIRGEKDAQPFDYGPMWAAVISKMATVPNIKKMSTFDFMTIYNTLK